MGKEQLKKRVVYSVLLFLSAIFYLIWYVLDGVVLTADAPSYINMQSDREPGYCMFLWLMRSIFGVEASLDAASIIQCLIAALAVVVLAKSMQDRFALPWFGVTAIVVIQYGLTLLNRFVAQRRSSYFNSIETEGLAYSFWVFFFLCLLGILYDQNKRSIIGSVVWAVILVSIRKQMLISFGLIFLCLIYIWWKKRGAWKAIIVSTIVIVVGLLCGKLIDCTYNYVQRGVFESHTGDSSFILGTEIYLADKEMVSYIKDPINQELFLKIMDRADEIQYNVAYAQDGWSNRASHYSMAYDYIKFNIVMVVIREYHDEIRMPEEQRDAHYNEIAGTLMKELLVPCIPELIRLFFCNAVSGLIITVLKVHPILNWSALVLYILYIALGGALWRKKAYETQENSALFFAVLVLLAILANVALTSITIFCQMRYMLYNTGLFYQAGFVMLLECNRIRKKH